MKEFFERHPWSVLNRDLEFVNCFSNFETALKSVLSRGERARCTLLTPTGKRYAYFELVTLSAKCLNPPRC